MNLEIGIAGLGLIGGSMAQALKAHTRHRVWGDDLRPEVSERACAEGAIDGALDAGTLALRRAPGGALPQRGCGLCVRPG